MANLLHGIYIEIFEKQRQQSINQSIEIRIFEENKEVFFINHK